MPPLASVAISFSASLALLLLLVAVAVAFSLFAYRHTVPDISARRKIVLVTLRSLALALLLFIIFEPVLNLERSETVEPTIAVLMDDSRSLTVEDGDVSRTVAVRAFVDDGEYASLSSLGDVKPYRFGAKVYPLQELTSDSLQFAFGETDIDAALGQVYEHEREHNLSAILLVSDGNVTTGKNPLYTATSQGLPVFVLGVGDTTERKDLLITSVLANDIAYLESSIPVDVTIRSAGFESGNARVSFREGGKTLATQSVDLRPGVNEYPLHFTFTPEREGVHKLVVTVETLEGELTARNNRRTFFIKVLKSRMSIAVIAGAPGADLSLLLRAIDRDKNLEATTFVRKRGASWYGEAPAAAGLSDADCIVLLGYPRFGAGTAALNVVRTLAERHVPLMIMLDRGTDLYALRSGLDAFLPYEIVQVRGEETQVFFDLAGSKGRNPVVTTGIPEHAWRKLPPLFKTESSVKARAGAQVLGTMRIDNIPFSEPLLLTRKLSRHRVLVWTAYGLWRWGAASDVLDGALPEFLISNSIRWLTAREDDKLVRIRPVKEFFDSGEAIEFTAQVYNESYEPVENAAVMLTVKSGSGDRELVLSPVGAGRYSGILETGDEGDFTYRGRATVDDEEIGSDAGRFSVGELNLEFQETRMNRLLLRQLAAKTGGAYADIADAGDIAAMMGGSESFSPRERILHSDVQLWNLAWLLAAVILLFAAEWYLRKQAGMI